VGIYVAVESIERCSTLCITFYVLVDGARVDLVVDSRSDGEAYLRPVDPMAEADVLALPRLGVPSRAYARPVSPR